MRHVLIKLAETDLQGAYDPDDPNASYAHRYLRLAENPPARPEFEPFIMNPTGTYTYQAFEKSVPLSAWDIDADPPRRLALGFLENNVEGGTVDGKYWPPSSDAASNSASDGPREWLWIFDTDYAENPEPTFQGSIVYDPLPVMYFLTVARDGDVPFSAEDEFLILPATGPLTDADVFEFTAPQPATSISQALAPLDQYSSIANLRLLDSLALLRYRASVTACNCPCHTDPSCDGVGPDVFDVVQAVNVAFRNEPAESARDCPIQNTDVDCSGATDVFDVVKIVDVAFRNVDPALHFCAPCNQP